jgi:hypothetical protein
VGSTFFRTAGKVQFVFRTAGKVQNFSAQVQYFSGAGSNDWSNTSQKRFRSVNDCFSRYVRRGVQKDAGRPSASEVPSQAAGRYPLLNSNFSFSEEYFSGEVQNFSEDCYSEEQYRGSKCFPNSDFPYLQIAACSVLATRPALGRAWGASRCLGDALRR